MQHFAGFTAVGKRNNNVAFGYHAQVAVNAFCRVQVKRRRTGAGKRCCHFAPDNARFAHAGNNGAAGAGHNHFNRCFKMFVYAFNLFQHGFRFHTQNLPRLFQHYIFHQEITPLNAGSQSAAYNFIYGQHVFQECFQIIQFYHIRPVRKSFSRVIVYFKE